MNNITPPQISDERIDVMADGVLKAAGSALRHYTTQKSKDDIASAMRAALAERDRQWLEMLEPMPIQAGPLKGLYRMKKQASAS